MLGVIRFRLLLSVTDVNPRGSAGAREKVRGEGTFTAQYLYIRDAAETGTKQTPNLISIYKSF